MVTKLLTIITREAIKKAKDQHRAKIKSIKAGKGTTSQKIDRMDKANDVLLKKIDQAKGEEFKQSQKMMKTKSGNPTEKMGLRKRKAKGGITMPMKKKSKMMARGGMKKKSKMMAKGGMKKSKMMARGGMKKSKMMARGGMKKTKGYARGGAARRK
tara:strand:- start:284 stop:751 length:468 start_codon:yes stop_codon:yes gene_type:complete